MVNTWNRSAIEVQPEIDEAAEVASDMALNDTQGEVEVNSNRSEAVVEESTARGGAFSVRLSSLEAEFTRAEAIENRIITEIAQILDERAKMFIAIRDVVTANNRALEELRLKQFGA